MLEVKCKNCNYSFFFETSQAEKDDMIESAEELIERKDVFGCPYCDEEEPSIRYDN